MWNRRAQRGFTLIEMIVAIVVLGVGLAGVLIAFTVNVKGSSDALVSKQLISVAETMMEEILLKPFAAPTASPAAGGACGAAGADRSDFDEVADYNAYQTPDVCDIDGNAVPGLTGYSVAVTVVGDDSLGIGAANTWRVTVTAAYAGQSMVLDGFKVRLP